MESIKLYWSSSKRNFGDWLSPAICARVSGRPIDYAPIHRCDLVAAGSLLGRLRHGWWAHKVHVWGTGFIAARPPLSSCHRYHAVRGLKSAALLKVTEIQAFGDPGLLADLILPDAAEVHRSHPLGIIPHYKDRTGAATKEIAAKLPEARILDVFSEPVTLLREIASHQFILSSSLHGLVAADALGIPNRWLKLSEAVRGDDFKFQDYYSVFGMEDIVPLTPSSDLSSKSIAEFALQYDRPGLRRIKSDLLQSFPYKPSSPNTPEL